MAQPLPRFSDRGTAGRDFFIKPYFWVLLAVAAFDLANYAFARGKPGAMLGMDARLLGFVIGIVAMVAIKTLAGSTANVF